MFTAARPFRVFDVLGTMLRWVDGIGGISLSHFSLILVDKIVCTHFGIVDIYCQFWAVEKLDLLWTSGPFGEDIYFLSVSGLPSGYPTLPSASAVVTSQLLWYIYGEQPPKFPSHCHGLALEVPGKLGQLVAIPIAIRPLQLFSLQKCFVNFWAQLCL